MLLALSSALLAAQVPLILDTDIGGGGCRDVDDVLAICVANALADRNEVNLLAVVQDTLPPQGVGVISVLNQYYGRGIDAVKIGGYQGGKLADNGTLPYVADLLSSHPSPVRSAANVPDSVTVYRRALASQADHSVVIASIGLLTNLADLFYSRPDAISPLDGKALFAQKVRLLALMGGRYPSSAGHLCECNLCSIYYGGIDHAAASRASADVINQLPPHVKVVYSGVEVGLQVVSGAALSSCAKPGNPCRQALINFEKGEGRGRYSWDPLTTLFAARDAAAVGCDECAYCDGVNIVQAADGTNAWKGGPHSNQSYLVLRDPGRAQRALDDLLCQPPKFGSGLARRTNARSKPSPRPNSEQRPSSGAGSLNPPSPLGQSPIIGEGGGGPGVQAGLEPGSSPGQDDDDDDGAIDDGKAGEYP